MVVTKGLLWLLLGVIVTAKVRYDKHQVFRVVPADKEQLQTLRNLEQENQGVSCVWCNIKQWKLFSYIHS